MYNIVRGYGHVEAIEPSVRRFVPNVGILKKCIIIREMSPIVCIRLTANVCLGYVFLKESIR